MSDTLPRMGRKPSGKPHRKPIQVKLSEDERDAFDEAAAAAGLETSTWMRAVCLSVSTSGFSATAVRPKKRKTRR